MASQAKQLDVENNVKSAEPVDNRFPPGVPYIVGNEGAERFSYYGMRQILYIYMVGLFTQFVAKETLSPEALADAEVRATQVTHLFMAGVYLFPMFGAILADRVLGKYRVIFWVSLIYCAGHAVLAIAGRAGEMAQFGTAEMLMYAGLGLIALGSGGIKPCVSANVGDQFTAKNGHLVAKVFDIFYFIINFGSFFASVLTPVLYKNFGPEVAFGVPGILMFIAAFIFWLGRDRFVKLPPNPGGKLGLLDAFSSLLLLSPIFALISGFLLAGDHGEGGGDVSAYVPYIIAGALGFIGGVVMFFVRQRIQQDTGFLAVLFYTMTHQKERAAGEDYWAPARKRFGEEAAEGPPAVLKIILVFSMVSVFWALFDQHSSTWIKQAEQMNLLLDVPTHLWDWFVFPGVIVAALYGGTALFMWVSNRPLTKKHHLGFAGLMAVWFFGALAMQLSNGGWKDLGMQAAQISALNPLMVMMIIPLLTFAVYNPLERAGRPMKPLMRMTIGMFLAAVAFLTVALLQQRIEASPPKSLHVLWQIIPYWLMTVAEVMVSVTGLAFAYTQAPRAMKSTIMGYWLLCVTFGNILVAFLAPLQKEFSLSIFFYVFAGLMAGAAVIFGIMAALYKGKTYLQQAAAH